MIQIKSYIMHSIWWAGLTLLSISASISIMLVSVISKQYSLPPYRWLCHAISAWTYLCLDIKENNPIDWPRDASYIITANHQTFNDIPLMMAILAKHKIYPRFIMKNSIRYIPFINSIARRLEFLYIRRDKPKETLRLIMEASKQPALLPNWLIFPEGTRAPLGSITLPKHAGMQWMLSSFKQHQWLDFTIIYNIDRINIHASLLPRPCQDNTVEKQLKQLWQYKHQLGLAHPADASQ